MARNFYDLGEDVTRSINVTNSAGVAADADSTPTVVLTDPNGGAVGSPTVNHGVTGEYYVVIPKTSVTVVGGYLLVWTVVIGGSTQVFTDRFEVTANTAIISLAEAKEHLNLSATNVDKDEQLRAFCDSASDACEAYTNREWRRQTFTETYDGGTGAIALRRGPVVSVTTVTENGVTVAASGYTLDANSGLLLRGGTMSPMYWLWGRQSVVVTYVVGAAVIPPVVRNGVKEMVRHLWETQRAGKRNPDDVDATTLIPRSAKELWDLAPKGAVVA